MQNNTLDMYEGAPGRGHVVHYQQDLGGSFGNFAGQVEEFWQGTETYWETHLVLASLFTLGLAPRQWDDPRLGALQGARGGAVSRARAVRGGALRAALVAADHRERRLRTADATRPLLGRQARGRVRRTRDRRRRRRRALSARDRRVPVAGAARAPRKIAYAYFSETTPLDHFVLRGRTLCFDDLWVESGLGSAASYRSSEGEVRGRCVALPARDGYRVVALRVQRAGERSPSLPVRVHVIMYGDAGHIVGIEH